MTQTDRLVMAAKTVRSIVNINVRREIDSCSHLSMPRSGRDEKIIINVSADIQVFADGTV